MSETLVRTRTVLRLIGDVDHAAVCARNLGHALFSSGEGRRTRVSVDAGVWEDMGRPDTITVSIEPGDRLNAGT